MNEKGFKDSEKVISEVFGMEKSEVREEYERINKKLQAQQGGESVYTTQSEYLNDVMKCNLLYQRQETYRSGWNVGARETRERMERDSYQTIVRDYSEGIIEGVYAAVNNGEINSSDEIEDYISENATADGCAEPFIESFLDDISREARYATDELGEKLDNGELDEEESYSM